jgi:hypothetical protein
MCRLIRPEMEVQQVVFMACRHSNVIAKKSAVTDEIQSGNAEITHTEKPYIPFLYCNQQEAKLAWHMRISL